MKCTYIVIFLFAFALQPTNAAPSSNDIHSIFDDLLDMNIRMSDTIVRAKQEYGQLRTNELKETLGKVVMQEWGNSTLQQIDSIKKFTTTEGSDANNIAYANENTTKTVISSIERTFDPVENRFTTRINNRETTDINKSGFNRNVLTEDKDKIKVPFEPYNKLVDDRNVNVNLSNAELDIGYSANPDLNYIDAGSLDMDDVDSSNTALSNVGVDNTDAGSSHSVNLDPSPIDVGNVDLESKNSNSTVASDSDSANAAAGIVDSEINDSNGNDTHIKGSESTADNEQAVDYEQHWGEETFNNESKDVGWVDSAL